MGILRGKAELLISRRRQDVLDMVDICLGADINVCQDQHARMIEKEGRRRRRRDLRNKGTGNPLQLHYDGLSSDDELLPSNEMKILSETGKNCCFTC